MLPGPNLIYECNHCRYPFKLDTIASGNNFGAKYWTDGAMDAPMLPRKLPFFKCRSCGMVEITSDQKIVDSYETYMGFYALRESEEAKLRIAQNSAKQEKYAFVEYAINPNIKELLDYIKTMNFQVKSELQVRLVAWRYGNDHRRYKNCFAPYEADEIQNMDKLLLLLPDDAESNLLRIEVLREKGCFDEALDLINNLESNEVYDRFINIQKNLIAKKFAGVAAV